MPVLYVRIYCHINLDVIAEVNIFCLRGYGLEKISVSSINLLSFAEFLSSEDCPHGSIFEFRVLRIPLVLMQ